MHYTQCQCQLLEKEKNRKEQQKTFQYLSTLTPPPPCTIIYLSIYLSIPIPILIPIPIPILIPILIPTHIQIYDRKGPGSTCVYEGYIIIVIVVIVGVLNPSLLNSEIE